MVECPTLWTASRPRRASGSPSLRRAHAGAGRRLGGLGLGDHVLVVAPTGSGKTLAAFLSRIDRLHASPPDAPSWAPGCCTCRRSRRSPSTSSATSAHPSSASPRPRPAASTSRGHGRGPVGRHPPSAAAGLPPARHPHHHAGVTVPDAHVGGARDAARRRHRHRRRDPRGRRHQARRPPRPLARTPRRAARGPARVGLSATVRPTTRSPASSADATGTHRGARGRAALPRRHRAGRRHGRPRRGAGTGSSGRTSSTTSSTVLQVRSTIVFCNSRGLAERLTARLNEAWAERQGAWHPSGDGSADARPRDGLLWVAAPPATARGPSPCWPGPTTARSARSSAPYRGRPQVRASALCRGHVQPRARHRHGRGRSGRAGLPPPSVASGLQRVGRAGHQVGEVSRGILYPTSRPDLVGAAVTAERMRSGLIEQLVVPANPLDVLAQHTVAAAALEPLDVEQWFDVVRRARRSPSCRARRSTPPSTSWPGVTRLMSSPSCVPGWSGTAMPAHSPGVPARSGWPSPAAAPSPTAACSPSSSSRRGRRRPARRRARRGDGLRVAHQRRLRARRHQLAHPGDHPRPVVVTPAFGEPARLPFWKGDTIGRPSELGAAIGDYVRREPGGREPARDATSTTGPARTSPRSCSSSARPPASSPPTAPSSSNASATSSATGASCCSRRTAAGPRAVGPGGGRPHRRAVRHRRLGGRLRRRHRRAAARHRRRPAGRRAVRVRGRRARRDRHDRGRRFGTVRVPFPRVRRPRPAPATPQSRAPFAALAATAAIRPAARGRPQVPRVPDPARDRPRVPARRLRPAVARAADRRIASREMQIAEVTTERASPFASGCCSATSPHSSTRATPRWRSGGPRRSPSTRRCSPSCSVGPSCASCSTRR